MGASLGGLAMLQAQRAHPGVFAGLYLQSSSFFHRVLDEQESGFERFNRITSFVDSVPRALQAQGYDTRLVENRDVHTYTGWRDTFDPNLVDLVQRVLQGESYAA